MKAIVVIVATIFIGVFADSSEFAEPFHTVDEVGNVHFGYNDGQSARNEIRTVDGIVRGAYQFVDANGAIQKVSYTSDPVNGYQVVESGANENSESTTRPESLDLPQPVQDTQEVIAARLSHLEALRLASLRTN